MKGSIVGMWKANKREGSFFLSTRSLIIAGMPERDFGQSVLHSRFGLIGFVFSFFAMGAEAGDFFARNSNSKWETFVKRISFLQGRFSPFSSGQRAKDKLLSLSR